jgi:hypothetical protein
VSEAALGRMLARRRYASSLASMAVMVVSAESEHDALQCSDSDCSPTESGGGVASSPCSVFRKRSSCQRRAEARSNSVHICFCGM